MPPKSRKGKGATGAPSPAPTNIKDMSATEQEQYLAQLKREIKKRKAKGTTRLRAGTNGLTKVLERKDKKKNEESARAHAEREYQSAKKRPNKSTADAPTTPAKSQTASAAGSGATKQQPTQPSAGNNPDSEAEASNREGEPASDQGYDSDVAIDPILRRQSRKASEANLSDSQLPATKKSKTASGTAAAPKTSKGAASISVATAKPLQTTVSGQTKRTKTARPPESDSSESSSSDSSEDGDSSSDESSTDDENNTGTWGPHTPYDTPEIAKGKVVPAVKLMSPTSKDMAENMRTAYSVLLATKDAFPAEKEARKTARKLFIAEVDFDLGGEDEEDEEVERRLRRRERAKADKKYMEHMTGMTVGVDSAFRGRIVEDAQPIVENEYGLLDAGMDDQQRREKIMKLLHNSNFTFGDWENRKAAYQCPALPKLLRKAFLAKQSKKGYALGLGPHLQLFADVPPALLAFLLTAIECVLSRWKTGQYDQHPFTMAKYEPIYTRHLKSMYQVETMRPGSLAPIRKSIWEQACAQAGIEPSTKVKSLDSSEGYMRLEDLDDLPGAGPSGAA